MEKNIEITNNNKKISIWQKLKRERENGRKKFRKDGL